MTSTGGEYLSIAVDDTQNDASRFELDVPYESAPRLPSQELQN